MSREYSPKVSIIIPVYNGSNYLREAIDSALSQTYENTEIIVINDGSTDRGKTDKICKSYGKRIRYFRKENGGVSSALNMGIENMEGEYFSWLSHDDVYYPEKVEKQIEFLYSIPRQEKVIIYANYELIDEKSRFIGVSGQNTHKELLEKPEYALLRGHINGITLLIPKSAFIEHGLFNENLRCVQDYDLWRKFMKTYRFVHMNTSLTKTRIHLDQDSNKNPNALLEGNPLWIDMMNDLSINRKKILEGSEYNFYREMERFLKTTPYREAENFTRTKMKEIYNSIKKDIKKSKVSVIIPLFGHSFSLKQSLSSVESQTYKNLEIILIDSNDNKQDLSIKKLLGKDHTVKTFELPEGSDFTTAWNRGIDEATGEYIVFLKPGDEFVKEKIEKQLLEISLTGYEISHTSYIKRRGDKEKLIKSGILTGRVIPQIIAECSINISTVMVKTAYLRENSFKFKEDIGKAATTLFWLEILRQRNLLGIDEALSIINIYSENKRDDFLSLEKVSNILKYLLDDREYSKYNSEIANLCIKYWEISRRLSRNSRKFITPNDYIWRDKPSSFVMKLIYLFKKQGFFVTVKKVFKKYSRRFVRKMLESE